MVKAQGDNANDSRTNLAKLFWVDLGTSNMDTSIIWNDIDNRLEELCKVGAVKLPSLSEFDLDRIGQNIYDEMKGHAFTELGFSHESFLKELGLAENLAPKLYKIASASFGYKGELSNQYHIARCVEPGNSKEMYRAHFDSHIFTLVIPIKIPESISGGSAGDLIYFPKSRQQPKSEITNVIGKAFHKKYASKEGIDKFSLTHQKRVDSFRDYQPLLFLGKTTLHTNLPVTHDCSSHRLTLLAHFFDDSPKYGIGGLMRILRNR